MIGVRKQHVYNWEHRKCRPKGTTQERIAKLFGLSMDFFHGDGHYYSGEYMEHMDNSSNDGEA